MLLRSNQNKNKIKQNIWPFSRVPDFLQGFLIPLLDFLWVWKLYLRFLHFLHELFVKIPIFQLSEEIVRLCFPLVYNYHTIFQSIYFSQQTIWRFTSPNLISFIFMLSFFIPTRSSCWEAWMTFPIKASKSGFNNNSVNPFNFFIPSFIALGPVYGFIKNQGFTLTWIA